MRKLFSVASVTVLTLSLFLLCTLSGIVTGCVNVSNVARGVNCFLYPNSYFEYQTNVTVWAGLEYIGVTNHADYVRVMSNFLLDTGQLTAEEKTGLCSDPFLATPNLPCVTFATFDPANRVAKYYEDQFKRNGWQMVRSILLVEYCNGGGDWIRVYRKGEALVRIHIMGPWKRDLDEIRGL